MFAEPKAAGGNSHVTVTNFAGRAHVALNDKPLRANFRRAMDGLMTKRAAQFPDAADLARLLELRASQYKGKGRGITEAD